MNLVKLFQAVFERCFPDCFDHIWPGCDLDLWPFDLRIYATH